MNKKQTILIFLLLILLSLVLYLIFTSESVSVKQANNSAEQIKQDNSVLLEADYKLKAKEFFTAYESLINNNSFTNENIAELKNKLLALKGVPKKFQDLHYKFVTALDKMQVYLSQKDEQEKSSSFQAINQLKADYSWLNN